MSGGACCCGLLLPCLCCPRSKHDRRRVRSSLTNTHREALSKVLSLPSCFFRAALSVVAVASLRLLQAPPFVEASLPRECVRTSLAHLAVGVLTCRLARDTGFLSPSRCLAESCVAGLTGCPPRPGSCPSRCQWRISALSSAQSARHSRRHHSSFAWS